MTTYRVEQMRVWNVAAESESEALELSRALEPSEVMAAEVMEVE